MTSAFWTPEKKKDYKELVDRRDKRRKYMREYIKAKRDSGHYKIFRKDGKVIFKNNGNSDEIQNKETQ